MQNSMFASENARSRMYFPLKSRSVEPSGRFLFSQKMANYRNTLPDFRDFTATHFWIIISKETLFWGTTAISVLDSVNQHARTQKRLQFFSSFTPTIVRVFILLPCLRPIYLFYTKLRILKYIPLIALAKSSTSAEQQVFGEQNIHLGRRKDFLEGRVAPNAQNFLYSP